MFALHTELEAVGVMKNLKYLLGAAVALTMVASTPALAVVKGSLHDLSAGTDEICVYCHTPHNGDTTSPAPLWNRIGATAAAAFTMYASPTIDMTISATGPQGVSLACLSCHDGVTAYNSIIRGTSSLIGTANMTTVGVNAFNIIGTDLGNDHPVSVTYDVTLAGTVGEFNASTGTVPNNIGGLPLYGATNDQVECATCHNPHDVTNGKFLRAANGQSTLCLTCHIK